MKIRWPWRRRISNLEIHAERELRVAGFANPTGPYDGTLAEAVMDLIKVFADQGHSGGSAGLVSEAFDKVSRFEPLTPLW